MLKNGPRMKTKDSYSALKTQIGKTILGNTIKKSSVQKSLLFRTFFQVIRMLLFLFSNQMVLPLIVLPSEMHLVPLAFWAE